MGLYRILQAQVLSDVLNESCEESYVMALQSYNDDIHTVLYQFCEKSMQNGIMIENKLENPTSDQIQYLNTTLGSEFYFRKDFIKSKLRIWLRPLTENQLCVLTDGMYEVLSRLQKIGKNESVLKNAYTKFMCWLYYCLRTLVPKIGVQPFYVLYEGTMGAYELYMLTYMALCGGNLVILDYSQNAHKNANIQDIVVIGESNVDSFPSRQMVKDLKCEILDMQKIHGILGHSSHLTPCVNAWLQDINVESVKDTNRCSDRNKLCSMYLRMDGVSDRNTYQNWLFGFLQDVKNMKDVVILEQNIEPIKPNELNRFHRENGIDLMVVLTMMKNGFTFFNPDLNQYALYHTSKILFQDGGCRNKLGKKVGLILQQMALLYRYKDLIIHKGCLMILEKQVLNAWTWSVLETLSEFGVDVLIFNPNKVVDTYKSDTLLVQSFDEVVNLQSFPKERSQAILSTTAYNAERDLDTMLYQSTGFYRNQQYKKAEPIVLRTMYEEIEQLWDENINMRMGFDITDDNVILPVIFAKVLGVKDGNVKAYQKSIERLVTGNDCVYLMPEHMDFSFQDHAPSYSGWVGSFGMNYREPVRQASLCNIADVLTNRKVDMEKVKRHPDFRYGYLQDEKIAFMVDRFDALLWSGMIEGVGQHGVENKLLHVFFNLPKDIVQLIQKWDFTKVNPKLVYVNTGESVLTLEDTMFIQYLSMLGFDVVMFIPTGYNIVDGFFVKKQYTEYQIGDYLYDLRLNIKRKKGFFG